MKDTRRNHPQYRTGPITTYEALVCLRAQYAEALIEATEVHRNYLNGAIATLDEAIKLMKTNSAGTKKAAATRLREIDALTDRERVMAQLARKIGRGCDAIYHGTRHLPLVLRYGKLLPPPGGERGIFLSRSPETAAYFASLFEFDGSHSSPGVLVLNRRSLTQSYSLKPRRYDQEREQDEREEVIWGRMVNIRRHLLGVVGDSDVTAILGPPKHTCLPSTYFSWPQEQRSAFYRKQREAGHKIVRDGRARVREIIIGERSSSA